MKPNTIYFLSFTILLFSGCDTTLQKSSKDDSSKKEQHDTRIVKQYFDNGRLKSEISVKGKNRHGITKNYSKYGQLLSEVNYANNRKNGLTVNYYASGKIHSQIFFSDGIKHGESTWFYENGKIFRINPFKDGKLSGIQKFYFEDGKVMAEIPYRNGHTGIGTKEYTKTGTLISKYPEIRFEEINQIAKNDTFILKVKLSNNSYRVTFYTGKLEDGIYMTGNTIEEPTRSGVCLFKYHVPPGVIKTEKLSIVAKYRTDYDFPYIIQKDYVVNLKH
ncbi:MAG: toxin-antitoxin system YwqK family antitoxin [Bacteroidales bacterium]|nr:toxin-antitoxin system YwqK family antitoxin [Bacteroidales bacterium]